MKTLLLIAASMMLSAAPADPLRTEVRSSSAILPGGPPRAYLCDKSEGELSRKALLAAPVVQLHGCVPSARVQAFTLRISNGSGAGVELRARDAKFTDQMVTELKKALVGSVITITDLDVVDDQGKAWDIPEVRFTLAA